MGFTPAGVPAASSLEPQSRWMGQGGGRWGGRFRGFRGFSGVGLRAERMTRRRFGVVKTCQKKGFGVEGPRAFDTCEKNGGLQVRAH